MICKYNQKTSRIGQVIGISQMKVGETAVLISHPQYSFRRSLTTFWEKKQGLGEWIAMHVNDQDMSKVRIIK